MAKETEIRESCSVCGNEFPLRIMAIDGRQLICPKCLQNEHDFRPENQPECDYLSAD
jgi:formylmethanofuran dehydrogenase subunit E